MKAIIIKTERLILRPLGPQDLDTVSAYSTDRENTRLMLYLPHKNRQETLDFLRKVEAEWAKERPAFYEFAILFEGRQIGSVSVDSEGETAGELGWIIHRDYWGRGIASEATAAVVDFAVCQLHRTYFFARCDSENTGSCRVMEKLGMKRNSVRFGRKNRGEDEARMEYRYEMRICGELQPPLKNKEPIPDFH
ncbi:MAG: GNAT family N-acetyltransferase [Eubacteriales bacterium]|nr:GNAT family N-acetyltransferase [Eubacteriales bacterium]